jgi:hypothetical protein
MLAVVATQLTGGRTDPPQDEMTVEVGAPRVGQIVTVGSFTVEVARFDCVQETDARRCVAALRVRNDALVTRSFPAPLQRVVGGIRRFVATEAAPAEINPGTIADVDLVFVLPETMHATRLELRESSRHAPVRVALQA